MQEFSYKKINTADEALGSFNGGKAGGTSASPVRFLAGGTTLIDLMKLEVETPRAIVDLNNLPLNKIEKKKEGGLHIGATVKNTELANHELVKKDYSVLSQAILAGASTQLRNKATTAGNLLQRTRCVYFRDPHMPCNKREPKSGCAAIDGFNRNLAIMGTSDKCIANNPSDMNVAMMALEATVHIQSASGNRDVAIGEFYLLPGETPEKETVLQPGELITGVTLPALEAGTKSTYLKLRDRASYEFALSSAAIIAKVQGGKFTSIRMAMGGIGARPWRSLAAEKILLNAPANEGTFRAAAEEFVRGAKPQSQNGFKIELAKRCLVHTLKQVVKA
jgi:xanthine dehydrogenase YagS FAD-binding subunit